MELDLSVLIRSTHAKSLQWIKGALPTGMVGISPNIFRFVPTTGSVVLECSYFPSTTLPLYNDFAAKKQWAPGVSRQSLSGGMY